MGRIPSRNAGGEFPGGKGYWRNYGKIHLKSNSKYCCNVLAIPYIKMSSKNRVSGNKGTVLACELALDNKKRIVMAGEVQVQWE